MTLASRFTRASAILAVTLLAALPLSAQSSRRRAAVPPSTAPGSTVKISGVITDATTGQPLAGAFASAGSRKSAATKDDGKYTLEIDKGLTIAVTAEQFAYQPKTQAVFGQEGAVANFALNPKPTVTVKLTKLQDGKDTYVLDIDTSKFAYLIPFSGYVPSDNANFCLDDGKSITPNKADIRRVIGPAVPVNFAPCCTLGPIMKAQVELKTGQTTTVYFNDSCFGNEVDFLGREKSSGQFVYFKFTDIAEVDFP